MSIIFSEFEIYPLDSIAKKIGFILELDIVEKKVLYLTRSTNKYKLEEILAYLIVFTVFMGSNFLKFKLAFLK